MGPVSYLLAKTTSLGDISKGLPFFRPWSQRRHPAIAERADKIQQLSKGALPRTFYTLHDADGPDSNRRVRLKALDVIGSYSNRSAL